MSVIEDVRLNDLQRALRDADDAIRERQALTDSQRDAVQYLMRFEVGMRRAFRGIMTTSTRLGYLRRMPLDD